MMQRSETLLTTGARRNFRGHHDHATVDFAGTSIRLDVCKLKANSDLLDSTTGSYGFPFHRICSCGGKYRTSLVSVLVWIAR